MTVYHSLVTIPMDTNVPRDAVVNTWTVDVTTDTSTDRDQWNAQLKAFYDFITDVYSTIVAQNGWTHKMYRETDPKPRPPIAEYTWNLTVNPTGSELPHELAICMSFQGDRVAGQAQARRRGRVYLGPIDTVGMTGGLVSTATQTLIRNGGAGLLLASQDPDWTWCVWSETTHTAVPVTSGWVDNGMDIQRRRGLDATTRVVF